MRRLLTAIAMLALVGLCPAGEDAQDARIRILEAENKALRAQVLVLQAEINRLKAPPAAPATSQPAQTPSAPTQPAVVTVTPAAIRKRLLAAAQAKRPPLTLLQYNETKIQAQAWIEQVHPLVKLSVRVRSVGSIKGGFVRIAGLASGCPVNILLAPTERAKLLHIGQGDIVRVQARLDAAHIKPNGYLYIFARDGKVIR